VETQDTFSIEEFQKAVSESVTSGMAQALLDYQTTKQTQEAGLFVTGDGATKSFRDVLVAIADKDREAIKTLQMGVGASGGFTVPEAFNARIMMAAAEAAIVRSRADVQTIGNADSLSFPTLDQTIAPAGVQSAFFGGVEMFWVEEGGAKPEAEPEFKLVTLDPHEMAAICYVTDKLLRHNAVGMERFLYNLFGKAIAFYEDYHFLNGDGVGKPQGVIGAPATLQVVRAGASAVVYADVEGMLHVHTKGPGTIWIMNHCLTEEILNLKDGNNNYLWAPNVATAPPQTLFGFPIFWSEKVPTLGTRGDIILADFSFYSIGDGSPIEVRASEHYRWTENITTFKAFREVDGKPWITAPFTLMDGTQQISPFVVLDTNTS